MIHLLVWLVMLCLFNHINIISSSSISIGVGVKDDAVCSVFTCILRTRNNNKPNSTPSIASTSSLSPQQWHSTHTLTIHQHQNKPVT